MKIFNDIIRVGYWFCVCIAIASAAVMLMSIFSKASAQTITVNIPDYGMHDSIADIMEVSNPICYIDGKITKVKVDTDCHECDARSYLQMVDIEIYPQYYMWEDTCSQFQHNHFTDYEVPQLHRWHTGTVVRVTYLNANSNWTIYDVSPRLGAAPMVTVTGR